MAARLSAIFSRSARLASARVVHDPTVEPADDGSHRHEDPDPECQLAEGPASGEQEHLYIHRILLRLGELRRRGLKCQLPAVPFVFRLSSLAFRLLDVTLSIMHTVEGIFSCVRAEGHFSNPKRERFNP